MKKKSLAILFTVIIAASLLAGCGSSKMSAQSTPMAPAEAALAGNASMAQNAALYDAGYGVYDTAEQMEENPDYKGETTEMSREPQAGRKLITTMNLSAETEVFDELMGKLDGQIAALGGYTESSEQWNGSIHYNGGRKGNRRASLTIRIPAEKLNSFVAVMEESSNITNKSKSVEDVTLDYVDLESHKKALLTAQERLLDLLEKAETVEDLIAIEDKLADIRYQLESMESKLRTYDNQINYSTVYLYIQEVERLTPAEQLTTWGRIQSGFAESLYDVCVGVRDFFVDLAINIPYIILWIVILAIALPVVLWTAKCVGKRRAKRRESGSYQVEQKQGKRKLPWRRKQAEPTEEQEKKE